MAEVQICKILADLGCGTYRDKLYTLVDTIINGNAHKSEYIQITEKTFNCLLSRHINLLKYILASSLDLQQAAKANKNTHNIMFVKYNNYIKLLYTQGKLPWCCTCNVPNNKHTILMKLLLTSQKEGKQYWQTNSWILGYFKSLGRW